MDKIQEQIQYWIDYKGQGDNYRKKNDRDCILTQGNLYADTLISLWLPLRYVIFECNKENVSFDSSEISKKDKKFLESLKDNLTKYIPDEKAIEKDLNRRSVDVTPALPSETVAPNGAAPVSGSEDEEGEDGTNNSFGLDMQQDDAIIPQMEEPIAVPTEETPVQAQPETDIVVPNEEVPVQNPLEEPIPVPNNEVPIQNPLEDVISVPAEEARPATPSTSVITERTMERTTSSEI